MVVEPIKKQPGTHKVERQIACPQCQEKGVFETWDCIDVSDTPELRERIIHDPMLFFYYCTKCYSRIRIDTPCLYIDRVRKMLIWLVPDPSMEMTMGELEGFFGPGSYSDYRCRAVRTWGEWREKILEMESKYDDRLFEFVKYGAYRMLRPEDKKAFYWPGYHLEYADETEEKPDELALVFMKDDEEKSTYVYPISAQIMELTQDIFKPMLDRLPETSKTGEFRQYSYAWGGQVVDNLLEMTTKSDDEDLKKMVSLWFGMIAKEIFQADIPTKPV